MAKRIFRRVTFVIITVLIWNFTSDVFINKNRNQNASGFSEARGADVIFIGTSQGALGINPQVLWDERGIAAYNFSGSGQYIGISYYVLQEVFAKLSPKVLVLDIRSLLVPEDFLTEGNLLYNFTAVTNPILRFRMYRDIIGQDPLYYVPLFRYHERWKELTEQDYESVSYVMGAELHPERREEITELPECAAPKAGETIGERELEYLKAIVSLVEQNHCRLIFLRMPSESDPVMEARMQELKNYGADEAIEVCDMMTEDFYLQSGLKPEDFRDSNHLTVSGAGKLSKWLAGYLASNAYVVDRRETASAGEWENIVVEARARVWELEFRTFDHFEDYYAHLQSKDGYGAVFVLTGEVSGELLSQMGKAFGKELEGTPNSVYWYENGILTADEIINIYYEDNSYELPGNKDLFISGKSGEISLDNRSVKTVNDGLNVLVYDYRTGRIVDRSGFDTPRTIR